MPEQLIQGFEKFCEQEYAGQNARMPLLVSEGQKPNHFIISCIDSRADPGIVLKAAPGKFFGFKPMGAIVRPYEQGTALAAGLQFALEYLKVPYLVILGHTQCGAIEALVNDIDDPEIATFINVAKTALKHARQKIGESPNGEELLREAERQVVLQSLENLKTYPSVAQALEANRVTLKGWMFDMQAGALLEYSKDQDKFEIISHYKNKKESCCA